MSQDHEQNRSGTLQHEAEHTKANKKSPVMTYLVILFAAAFLLLLLSYFMQQRVNQEKYDNLQQTSNSAVQTLENLIAERDDLKEQNEALNKQLEEVQAQLSQADKAREQAENAYADAAHQANCLSQLNQIRALYNQGRYREVRERLASYTGLEEELEKISAAMTEEDRAIYDPLAAYRNLADWLN